MRTITLFTILWGAILAHAQVNMVVNPGFETITSCPMTEDDLVFAPSWYAANSIPGFNPQKSPLFSTCVGYGGAFSVPLNDWGKRWDTCVTVPCNNYSMICTFSTFGANTRLFIGGELIEETREGDTLYWSAHISLTDNATQITNNIGISTYPFPASNGDLTTPMSQHTSLVGTKKRWDVIGGSFVADSAHKFFAIGNFEDDTGTVIGTIGTGAIGALYYIDNVCISKFNIDCWSIASSMEPITFTYSTNNTHVKASWASPGDMFEICDLKGIKMGYGNYRNGIDITSLISGIYICTIDGRVGKIMVF